MLFSASEKWGPCEEFLKWIKTFLVLSRSNSINTVVVWINSYNGTARKCSNSLSYRLFPNWTQDPFTTYDRTGHINSTVIRVFSRAHYLKNLYHFGRVLQNLCNAFRNRNIVVFCSSLIYRVVMPNIKKYFNNEFTQNPN